MKSLSTLAAALAALTVAMPSFAANITGAGSTFAAPIYNKWADAYHKAGGGQVNYQGIGSSGGIKQIIAKTVDFGGTDAPLKDDELAKQGLVQFPTVVGGVVLVVNLPGIQPGGLSLSGEVLGDIYLGKIKRWNDAQIAKLNPGVKLPDTEIAPVRRADGSGTTFVFTNYLSKVNNEWRSKVGEGATVSWPLGTSGKGNDGVAAFVQRLPGSIGYVEYAYAKQNKLTYTKMVNAEHNTVAPTIDTFKAAAAGADWSKTFYQILTNEPGKNTWPIVAATYAVVQAKQDKPEQGAEALKFFDWAYKHGEAAATELDYISLPKSVVEKIHDAWKNVKDASGKPVAY